MIREGEPEVTLKYLAQNPHRKLAINSFTEGTFADRIPGAREQDVLAGMRIEVWRREGRTQGSLLWSGCIEEAVLRILTLD